MSLTTEILKRIDATPVDFNGRDVRPAGATRSGFGSALDRLVKGKILQRRGGGYYKRLVPSAMEAYPKMLQRKSATAVELENENAERKPGAGRPRGDDTNIRRALEAMQALGETFHHADLQKAVPGMPKSSCNYALKKAVSYGLLEHLGRGTYAKRAGELVDAYYERQRSTPRGGAAQHLKPAKQDADTVAGPGVGMRRPDGLFQIMLGGRNFLAEEVAIIKRNGKEVR